MVKSDSIDAGRSNCAISLGLFIPRGYKLGGDVNPYDALNGFLGLFQQTFMMRNLLGNWTYRELNIQIPEDAFGSEVSKYYLEKSISPHRAMNPSGEVGTVYIPQDKMPEFFAEASGYEELACYSEILIGNKEAESCIRVEVPRRKKYRLDISSRERYALTLNGNPHTLDIPITEEDAKIEIYSTADSRCYMPASVNFTIRDLLEGKRVDHVEFRPDEEKICVDMPSSEERDIYYKLIFQNAAEQEFRSRRAAYILKLNGRKVQFEDVPGTQDVCLKLTGRENSESHLEVEEIPDAKYRGVKYKWIRCQIDRDNKLVVIVTEPIIPKPQEPPTIVQLNGEEDAEGTERKTDKNEKDEKRNTHRFVYAVVALILVLAIGFVGGVAANFISSNNEIKGLKAELRDANARIKKITDELEKKEAVALRCTGETGRGEFEY